MLVISLDSTCGDMVLRQYLWGNLAGGYVDELVQMAINDDPTDGTEQDCERIYYAMQDTNFNVLGVVDEAGTLVERYEYSPYGERTVYFSAGSNDPEAMSPTLMSRRVTYEVDDGNGGTITLHHPYGLNPIGHQGLMHDEELGLIYNRARMLHPKLGRFIQRDPLGYVDGMNFHEYMRSRPQSGLDPSGTEFIWDPIGPGIDVQVPGRERMYRYDPFSGNTYVVKSNRVLQILSEKNSGEALRWTVKIEYEKLATSIVNSITDPTAPRPNPPYEWPSDSMSNHLSLRRIGVLGSAVGVTLSVTKICVSDEAVYEDYISVGGGAANLGEFMVTRSSSQTLRLIGRRVLGPASLVADLYAIQSGVRGYHELEKARNRYYIDSNMMDFRNQLLQGWKRMEREGWDTFPYENVQQYINDMESLRREIGIPDWY